MKNHIDSYTVRITKRRAKAFALMYPLPEIGSEIVVAITPTREKLYLQNVSGEYRLHSSYWPISMWAETFGIAS